MAAASLAVAILAGGAATRLGGRDKGLELLAGRPLVAKVVDAIREMDMLFKPSAGGDGVCDATTGLAPGIKHPDSKGHLVGAASAATLFVGRASRLKPLPQSSCSSLLPGSAPMKAREMSPALFELLIVANRNHDAYARYAPTVSDLAPGFRGPLAGVAAAFAACSTPLLLTVPVDCPDPPLDLVTRLMAALHTNDAVVAHDGERRQPLFALYRRGLAASAARAAQAGQGVWQWQTSVGAAELDFSDRRRQFRNLNNAEDFADYANEHGFDI